ncbi:MAG: hypothetical protein Q9211_001226 [Gyalolechia sp. 1 TL-2023]
MVTASALGPSPPAQYTDCHSHGDELYVRLVYFSAKETVSHQSDRIRPDFATARMQKRPPLPPRDPQLRLKQELPPQNRAKARRQKAKIAISMLVLTVFGPILLVRFAHVHPSGYIFTVLKQFGTGVIISTAFVHLLTHADLMFANECLGALKYEATTTSIVVAGAFIAFLVQYTSFRLFEARSRNVTPKSSDGHTESMSGDTSDQSSQTHVQIKGQIKGQMPSLDDPLSVLILEAGIIFHSAIIGVTLVVAGDSFYKILLVLVIFHQMFEGLALGVRISKLGTVRLRNKLLMASAFALITPLGMAIGLGVLNSFNGNDKATIIAIGTLDAFSAGILVWTGFIQMWGNDWMYGDLRDAGVVQTCLGMAALVSGLVAMSVLGKWA